MRRRDEGLNNSCFVRMLFFCRGRTDKVREVEITTQCPECHGDHLVRDYSRAEIVCEDCGLVLDDMIIDEGPEWRAFDSEQRESRERAGPPSTIMAHDKGLSTSIGWRNKDAYDIATNGALVIADDQGAKHEFFEGTLEILK